MNRHFKAGLPMLILLGGGSYVLSGFVQGRVDQKDMQVVSKSVREFNIDQEYEETMKKLDVDNSYHIKKIDRPEDTEN